MKQITLVFLTLLSSLLVNTQNKFDYTDNGLTKYIVVNIDSCSASKLYNKTIHWVGETYKNPDEVLKMKIENEKIRFDGFQKSAFSINSLGIKYFLDARYSIEVSFKDNKIRFKPISLEQYSEPSQYSAGGWSPVSLITNSWLYKKNGKPRKTTENYINDIPNLFNDLVISLNTYLLKKSGTVDDQDDDW